MNFSAEQLEKHYQHTLFQLRLEIEEKFGNITNFAKESGLRRDLLSKVFSENIKQDMSIGTYTKIVLALRPELKARAGEQNTTSQITLKEYWSIDHHFISLSATMISNNF